MYKFRKADKTVMNLDNTKPGETIEEKVQRLIQNKEPIKDGAPIIFTEKSGGVNPAYNIRTDRWEIAVEALGIIEKSRKAKKEDMAKVPGEEAKVIKGDFGKTEPTVSKTGE